MSQKIYALQHQKKLPKLDELDKNSFIWLPLKNVPIDEHYPIDSMHQPALKLFELLSWTAFGPFGTDERKFMCKLAFEHEEMGYFLIHHQDIFGIIGVEEHCDDCDEPGRAVIFNATGIDHFIYGTSEPMMLDLVYSGLKYPCTTFLYAPGEISNYTSIRKYCSTEPCVVCWADDD